MKILITGGAGFIGSSLSQRLVKDGHQVHILDNLSRKGSKANLKWLLKQYKGKKLSYQVSDIRDFLGLKKAVFKSEAVFHLAAQVAVTKSVLKPREDFEVNALGSFNVLEAARLSGNKPMVVFASSNKVYGALDDLKLSRTKLKYQLKDKKGIDENQPLDFHSPYGCSNGVADQYTRDYFRIYGLPTVVFRQSCIYGARQTGQIDQGWVAHFVKQATEGKPITIFGDGKQVRDLLYVDDLVEAYVKALGKINQVAGEVYNIGGGRQNAYSLLEVISMIEQMLGKKTKLKFAKQRLGDQKMFISDNSKVSRALSWRPKMRVQEGLKNLI